MEIKKNENIPLIIGFTLILFVIVFTLFRNNFSSKSNKPAPEDDIQTNTQKDLTKKYTAISPNELNKKISLPGSKEAITLLDVRPFEEYVNEHIVDSINIPISDFPVGSKIDSHSLIVVIGTDNEDKNIDTALGKLKQESYTNAIKLAGGITAWKQFYGATVTYGDPKSFIDQAKVSYLDPASLNDAITKKVPVFIVDVRSNKEFQEGHIAGAKNIPIEEIEKRRKEITESKVVVVGINELQEFQASVQMHDMLLISPFVMRTAMPGWKEKGFQIVK